MTVKEEIQNAMKEAMKNKDKERLECLRMAKGALLMQEKSGQGLTDESARKAIRAEVKKRQQSLDVYRELGKEEEAGKTEQEIRVLEEFLPRQLTEAEVEEKVRAYLAENPEINHAGKLTGAMKKELGEQVDGKMLNEVCKRVLEQS